MGVLVDLLAMDTSTLSRNLRPLERAELIRIDRLAEDRRVRIVMLAERGAEVLTKALPLWREAQDGIVHSLGKRAAGELRTGMDGAALAVGGSVTPGALA